VKELNLRAVPDKRLKTAALESAYNNGMDGCILQKDSDAARKAADRFRDAAGANSAAFDAVASDEDDELEPHNGVEGCYVYTALAFQEFAKYGGDYPDWLFGMYQDSGCCVGASGQEMMCDLLGKQSASKKNSFCMFALSSMVTYAYRNHCGSGWYMGAHAAEMLEHGWLPATVFDGRKLGLLDTPEYNDFKYDDEDECEYAATSKWCRGNVPSILEAWMEENFMFESGGIVELGDDSGQALLDIAKRGGCIHHGSNYTSGSGGLDTIRRIGGHAQTDYGSDASDQCIEWFKSKGVNCSTDDFVKLQGQTWGGSWSGEIADADWPFGTDSRGRVVTWADVLARKRRGMKAASDLLMEVAAVGGWGWGPKPEGSWVVTRSTFQRYFAPEAYVYLPKFGGIPGVPDPDPDPEPEPEKSFISGTVYGEILADRVAIRGTPTVTIEPDTEPGEYIHLIEPAGVPGEYKFTRKIL